MPVRDLCFPRLGDFFAARKRIADSRGQLQSLYQRGSGEGFKVAFFVPLSIEPRTNATANQ
jgi:hypothetical protein